jgi:hypothetical protein
LEVSRSTAQKILMRFCPAALAGLFHARAGRMAGMEEKREKRSGCGTLIFAAIGLLFVLLPILYVLSIGLFIWLQTHGYISLETAERVDIIYEPLQWVISRSQSFREFIEWYQSLFTS